MSVPLEAAKRGKTAGNALLGDIYTRRWTTVKGTGKKKREVEHELKVNPVSIGLGAVAAGVAAVGAGMALWLMQRKVTHTDGKTLYLVIDVYDEVTLPSSTTEQTITIPATPFTPEHTMTVTVPTDAKTLPTYAIVRSKRGVPYGRITGPSHPEDYLTKQQRAMGFTFTTSYAETQDIELNGRAGHRFYLQYDTTKGKTYSIGEREGFGIDGGIFG